MLLSILFANGCSKMKNKNTTHIRCPHCNERVDIEKAIATAYQEELQHTFDKKIDEERNRVRKETEGMGLSGDVGRTPSVMAH